MAQDQTSRRHPMSPRSLVWASNVSRPGTINQTN